jgi:hypothetical protein
VKEVSAVAVKVKEKAPGQRACNEKDAKGELCVGHLKRWHTPDKDVVKQLGKGIEIYRCERCHTLYRPVGGDLSTAGQKFERRPVNILGAFQSK